MRSAPWCMPVFFQTTNAKKDRSMVSSSKGFIDQPMAQLGDNMPTPIEIHGWHCELHTRRHFLTGNIVYGNR